MEKMASKQGKQKPLRDSNRGMKDIADTYQKNQGGRSIPITDADEVNETQAGSYDMSNEKGKEPKITFDEVPAQEENTKEEANEKNEEVSGKGNPQEEIENLKDQLVRKAAELENFRRRTRQEKQELVQYGNKDLLLRLLEISDNFDNAFDAGEKSAADSKMLEGFKMIYKNMLKIFEEFGVKEIETKPGTKFDVEYHEAVMAMPSDQPEGSIVHIAQKGYMYGEKVLRHAKVVTSKGAEE
jgi:molecular chaperone GrpE